MITLENNVILLKRNKDIFTIKSKLEDSSEYTLTLLDCSSELLIKTESISGTNDIDYSINGTKTLNIEKDGYYKLEFEASVLYFSSWKNNRTKLIELIEKNLCNKCKGCDKPNPGCRDKESETCIRNQSLINYMQVYNNLIKPFSFDLPIKDNLFLTSFNETSIYNNLCTVRELLCNQLLETSIDGKSHTNQDLFNYFISIYYLGLYLYDKSFIPTTIFTEQEVKDELIYLKEVYKYDIIKKCIFNLGLNIDDLLNIVTDTSNVNVYYWQLDGVGLTIDDVTPLLTNSYINSKDSKTFIEFEQGVAIINPVIGRMIFVIKSVLTSNFIIYNYLGNDVTNEFDVTYNEDLQAAIFITKEYQTFGTVTFKIKTIGNE